MTLNINGKECSLNFGIGFIRELDKKYFIKSGDNKFGNGLETRAPMLMTGDAVTLSEFIYLGTARMEKGRPTPNEIDDYIDEADDIEALFDEVVEELKKSNACKTKTLAVIESLRIAEEQIRKQREK